ncbi:hypothetical protein HF670_07445 [Acidithiobacillus thiooxidans]|jgi:hypothetical protein|uniref:hypothetical protein n=1 Tax=Acidithiobacillus thiooxidans TaxID=930 RepID=UPI001C07150B|nr:hypothetical protein [Acidithiobacillus thiooxidans]MBU2839399.1 hypothetical protein [Acidithiobacillus thiooxidans]
MNDSKIVGITEPRRPPNAGKGRVKGTPNKVTADVREMVLGALEQAGGQQWLAKQADENPTAFMALLGKLLPKQIDLDASITASEPITEIRRTIVDPGEHHDR